MERAGELSPACNAGDPGCDAPINVSSTNQGKGTSAITSGSQGYIGANGFCLPGSGGGCITSWSGAGGGVSGSGTAGYIPEWNGSNSLGNSTMLYNGSALAIPGPPGNWTMEVGWPPGGTNYGILVGTGDLVKAAIDGRLPRGMGIARLADLPVEWSKQHQMLGLSGH